MTLLLINIWNVSAQTEIHLDDRDDYFKEASALYRKGELEEGKKIVDAGLQKYPKDSDLRMLMGRYYYERQMYDEARFELNESLNYNKNNSSAKQILVSVEMETQRYSSAICYINELLEINPYWKELWLKKIDIYRLQGNIVEANRQLKRISQIYPDDIDLRNAYLHYVEEEAKEKISRSKINEAIDLTATLVEEDPYNEEYYIQLANNYLKAGDTERALIVVEKGLYNIPSGYELINKKTDILGQLKRYGEALTFLDFKIKEGNNATVIRSRYNHFLEEAARHERNSDAYVLYGKLYERNPHNEEAFNYLFSQAVSRKLYEDALDIIEKAKTVKGETKELLAKEKHIHELMGAQPKADKILVALYQKFPEDEDILFEYTSYRLRQAKENMNDQSYEKAMNHWAFIAEFGDEEQQKVAMISLYNCYYQLGRYDRSLNALNRLTTEYPDELEWGIKKAVIYGKQKEYMIALQEYAKILKLTDKAESRHRLDGYDELAAEYVKELIEEYRLKEAMQIIGHWQSINPESELFSIYAINISARMKDYDNMARYALLGLEYRPDNTFCRLKLAEAYNFMKENEQSLDILTPALEKNPYHTGLINAHSQSNEDYARQLIKDKQYKEAFELLENALAFDPDNKSLKYWKGVTYEKLGVMDSAYYYQSFYEPSPIEFRDFEKHLYTLKSRTYKNEFGIFHWRGRYSDQDVISTISTAEYTRYEKKNIYIGRLNYSGRQAGKGIQAQAEWSREWTHKLRTHIDAAVANKFFPGFMANASVFKTIRYEWEGQLGLGYRNLYDTDDNMVNLIAGVAKELDPWWLNARYNSVFIGGDYYYNIFGQARFNIISAKTYLTVMGSIGSAPDVEAIDNQLYNGFSVTNSMVGLGLRHMVTDNFSVGIFGNLYNYEDKNYNFPEGEGQNRNFHNILLQLHVRF